jgi:hypothetical protein
VQRVALVSRQGFCRDVLCGCEMTAVQAVHSVLTTAALKRTLFMSMDVQETAVNTQQLCGLY